MGLGFAGGHLGQDREGDSRLHGEGTEPCSHTSTDTLAFSRLLGMLPAALHLPA